MLELIKSLDLTTNKKLSTTIEKMLSLNPNSNEFKELDKTIAKFNLKNENEKGTPYVLPRLIQIILINEDKDENVDENVHEN